MSEIEKSNVIKVTIDKKKIEELFKKVNTGRDPYVRLDSHQFVDKIIELYFKEIGYDFWDNPYPDVEEWVVTKEKEIIFTYIKPNEDKDKIL